jgi:hypothetical protein
MNREVWVLHISHKHGDSFWVFSSQDLARRRVELWASEDFVEAYFEKVEGRESYRIEAAGLDEF